MAERTMSPQLAQMVADFTNKHPSFDLSTTGINPFTPAANNQSDPEAVRDFMRLRTALDNEDFHFGGTGNPEADTAAWKQIVMVAAAVGAPVAAHYLAPIIAGTATPEIGVTTTSYGGMTTPGVVGATTAAGSGTGLLSQVGNALQGRAGDILGGIGRSIGDATQAAGTNREIANNNRESAQREYNRSLNERSVIESNQRNDAEKDVYRAGWYANRRPSPLNTAGVQPTSPNYTSTLSALETEGMRRLETPPQYSTDRMPAVEKFVPQGPGAAETAGTWTAPILSTLGNLFRRTQPKPAGS